MAAASSGEAGASVPVRVRVVGVLGVTQILGWGSTYYLPAVLGAPIADHTGWPLAAVVGGLSWAMIVAGIAAPRVGRTIDRYGGRWVLAASSLILASGLAILGAAGNLATYYAAWTCLGLGMASGLYDAAFSTIGRLLGAAARPSITGLTLIAGFASTVAWPAITLLEQWLGWRGTCFLLAGLHAGVGTALHLLFLPSVPPAAPAATPPAPGRRRLLAGIDRRFLLLTTAFTLFAFVATTLSVHILELVRALGLDAVAAVAVGMVIGPAQVAARLVEFTFGRSLHPVWTARCGMALNLLGIAMLAIVSGPATAVVATAFYGAGNGILTIARGTLPLALFGAEGYGARMGLMARPGLVAQALAPIALAPVLEHFGPLAFIGCCVVLALGALLAFALLRPPAAAADGPPP